MKSTLGTNFPVADYYKDCIVDAHTLMNKAGWWSAILLLKEPKTEKLFLALYKWQLCDNVWKTRMRWKFKSRVDCEQALQVLAGFASKLS